MPDVLLPGFTYDERTGRYRSDSTGRWVARRAMQGLLDFQINERADRLARLTSACLVGDVTAEQWLAAMRDELRRAHLQNRALGAGGWDRLTPHDYGVIGAALKADYRRLIAFAAQLADGSVSEAQALNRINMYLGQARLEYWQALAERQAPAKSGMVLQERRVLGAAEHCPQCVIYAHWGWQPAGVLPRPGEQSQCDGNCRCAIEVREVTIGTAAGTREAHMTAPCPDDFGRRWYGLDEPPADLTPVRGAPLADADLFNPHHDAQGRFAAASGSGRAAPANESEAALRDWTEQLQRLDGHRSPLFGNAEWRYSSMYDWLAQEGRFYDPAPLPKGVRRGRAKLCYMNAYQLADRDPERYALVEGLAHPAEFDIAIEHAWAVDRRTGQVIDTTWDKPGRAYLGVEIPLDVARRVMAETGVYGILPEAARVGLLQKGLADFAEVALFNPYHDARGRFAEKPGADYIDRSRRERVTTPADLHIMVDDPAAAWRPDMQVTLFYSKAHAWRKSLTPDEERALHHWLASGALMRKLQSGEPLSDPDSSGARLARAALPAWESLKAKSYRFEGAVYRGLNDVPREVHDAWRPGATITLNNDQSASEDIAQADLRSHGRSGFGSKPVLWRIKQRSGISLFRSEVTYGDDFQTGGVNESEVVLPKGARYRITARHDDGWTGRITLDLEELDASA